MDVLEEGIFGAMSSATRNQAACGLKGFASAHLPVTTTERHRPWLIPSATLRRSLHEHWLFILILSVGVSVRLAQFGSIPPGLNQDEAALGYDSFSVLHYGIDRNGFHNPVVFVSWGSGMNALPGYLAMPFYLLFGLSTPSLRAVNLIAGILSLIAFYGLIRRTGDEALALIAMFFLAISPWHIMISRWGLESNLLPTLFLLGVLFLCRGWNGGWSLLLAGLFFGLTLWAYGPAYVATPLFLALVAAGFLSQRWRDWRRLAQAGGIFSLVSVPIAVFVVVNQFQLSSIRTPILSIPRLTVPRWQTMSTLFGDHSLAQLRANARVLRQLLLTGDDGLIWNALPGFGYLYVFGFPLAILGVLVTVTRKRWWTSPVDFAFMAWLFSAVIVAVAFLEEININRVNIIFLPLIFFAAVGTRAIATSRSILITIIAFHCILFARFVDNYFVVYRPLQARVFNASFGEAINEAARSTSGPVCVTTLVPAPYVFVLYYRKVDPHEFVRSVQYVNPGKEFRDVSSFGRYTFGLMRCDPRVIKAYVADKDERPRIDESRFSLKSFGRYIVARRR